MRITKTLISVALLLLAWSATAGIPRTQAQQTIDAICAKEPLRSALVGVLAVRADGDTIVAVNHRQKLVPASNVKLLTTGMALQLLGANFRFETRLGYTGTVEDGTLHGDVYILGDPRYFNDHTPQNLGWSFDDLGTYYGAGPAGLNFFENAQNFYITPGGAGNAVNYRVQYPETPWMHYENHTVTGAARSSNTLYYVNSTLVPVGEIAGSFPADRRGYTLECSNAYGAFTCAYYFHNFLRTEGVEVTGGWGDITQLGEIRTSLELGAARTKAPATDSIRIAGSAWSAPLADIVADTNRESDNFYAEALLKTVAMHLGKTARQDDLDDAAEAGLRRLGLRPDGACRQFDGSGLSRKNYVSADFFVRFLRKMMALPVWNAYFDSLPVPGEKGTLENRFDKALQEFKDRIHMKSGSMNGVRCFSGYILASDGDPKKTIIFSLLTNNCTASSYQAMPILDSMIEAIAAEN